MSTEKEATKKRRGTSLPLIVGFLILGVVGYFFGEKIMTYVFYLQEGFIATSGAKGGDAPANTMPDTSGDPNIGPGPSVEGPGLGSPGSSATSTERDEVQPDAAKAAPESASETDASTSEPAKASGDIKQ
jgi:hypothetical protein